MTPPRTFGETFGARVRARREALGLTQAKLAKNVGVTPNYIGVMERGLKLPTLDTLVKLARALEASPADLLDDVRSTDTWIDEMITVATTIPEAVRPLALALLKTIATSR